MSEQTELIEAASTGAAAAVAAVADEQAEELRASEIAVSAEIATGAAEVAAERAEQAVAVSETAADLSVQATQETAAAIETASVAAEISYANQSDIQALREELNQRDERLMSGMRELFERERQPRETPTEVVVTHGTDSAAGNGDNPGGSASSGDAGNTSRPKRHKFGR
jgi:hypothetical protein